MTNQRKLFVSNIDFEVNETTLKDMFGEHGTPLSVVIAVDKETKRSKGFAFVEMSSEDEAKKAVEALNDSKVNGRSMKVTYDKGSGGQTKSFSGGPNKRGGHGGKKQREMLPPIQRIQLFRKKTKSDPFTSDPKRTTDYRDVAFLAQYLSETGKIQSRKHTGLSAFHQRKITKAIKRAQSLGLMPYSR